MRNWRYKEMILAGLVLFAGALAPNSQAAGPADSSDPAKQDEAYRKLIIGVWQDHYKGTRTMTVQTNGTATMVVELSGLTGMLYASRLRFDMKWEIENGRLKKRTVSGDPPGKVKTILNLMGDRVDERILDLSQERLLLLDGNGKTKYDWKRLPPAPKTEQK